MLVSSKLKLFLIVGFALVMGAFVILKIGSLDSDNFGIQAAGGRMTNICGGPHDAKSGIGNAQGSCGRCKNNGGGDASCTPQAGEVAVVIECASNVGANTANWGFECAGPQGGVLTKTYTSGQTAKVSSHLNSNCMVQIDVFKGQAFGELVDFVVYFDPSRPNCGGGGFSETPGTGTPVGSSTPGDGGGGGSGTQEQCPSGQQYYRTSTQPNQEGQYDCACKEITTNNSGVGYSTFENGSCTSIINELALVSLASQCKDKAVGSVCTTGGGDIGIPVPIRTYYVESSKGSTTVCEQKQNSTGTPSSSSSGTSAAVSEGYSSIDQCKSQSEVPACPTTRNGTNSKALIERSYNYDILRDNNDIYLCKDPSGAKYWTCVDQSKGMKSDKENDGTIDIRPDNRILWCEAKSTATGSAIVTTPAAWVIPPAAAGGPTAPVVGLPIKDPNEQVNLIYQDDANRTCKLSEVAARSALAPECQNYELKAVCRGHAMEATTTPNTDWECCKNTTGYVGCSGAPAPAPLNPLKLYMVRLDDTSGVTIRCQEVNYAGSGLANVALAETYLNLLKQDGKVTIFINNGSEIYYLDGAKCETATPAAISMLNKLIPAAQAEDALDVNKDSVQNNSLEITEPGRYSFFYNNSQVATKDIVIEEGKVIIKPFIDSNSNNIKDTNEKYISDLSEFRIAKQGTAIKFNLTAGWNLISIPLIDDRAENPVKKASDLVEYWRDQDAQINHVAKFSSGKFVMYSNRGEGKDYSSNDFNLVPGEGIFVFNSSGNRVLTFSGKEFKDPINLDLVNGWNLIGIIAPGQSYTSETLLKKMEQAGIGADTLSQFDSGKYQSVIYEDQLLYGNNFNIADEKGYFLRVNSNAKSFTP